nr:MAG TPA: hypothetical protein [Caudoviricetes sp.]
MRTACPCEKPPYTARSGASYTMYNSARLPASCLSHLFCRQTWTFLRKDGNM